MNESKVGDPRQWKKWKESGAIGGAPEAKMNEALKTPIKVDATGTFQKDGKVMQTLSLGSKVIAQGEGYTVTEPVTAVVVPGDKFRPGDMVDRKSLPKKTKPVERVFPEE